MTTRRLIVIVLCLVIFFFWQTDLFGQPPTGGPPDDPGPDPDVPITGIEYLIGGGLAYGIRSLIKSRKKNSD